MLLSSSFLHVLPTNSQRIERITKGARCVVTRARCSRYHWPSAAVTVNGCRPSFDCSAVGMAEDSADSSLLTSAIEEDSRKVYRLFPTEARFPYRESPDSSARPEVNICNDDAGTTTTTMRGRHRLDDGLLSEYAEMDGDYGDSYGRRGSRLSQSCPRLSRICSKSKHAPLSRPNFVARLVSM